MARRPRIDFPGAHHHVTVRGDRGDLIFVDDLDTGARTVTDRLVAGMSLPDAVWSAHVAGGMSLSAIALEPGLSLARISRMVSRRGREGSD